MFQSSHQRKISNEVHLCDFCKKNNDCVHKPEETQWRYVLKYCQVYDGEELDYFKGEHSR